MGGAAAVYGVVRHASRSYWIACVIAGCATLLLITPQLLVMLEVIRTNERGIAWIPWPDVKWAFSVLRSLAVGEHSWNTALTKVVGVGSIGLIAWSSWRLRKQVAVLVLGVVLPVLGFACLWGVSLVQPVMMPRTALWMVVPLCVLTGCGLATIQWRGFRSWAPIMTIAAALALMSAINMNGRTEDRPWPRFFARLAQEAQPLDEVVAGDREVLCVLAYYTTTDAPRNGKQWQLERGPDQRYRSRQRIPLGCNEVEPITIENLSGRLARGTVVWLLAGDDLQRYDVEAVIQALGPEVTVTTRYEWRGKTLVWRVARR